MLSETSTHWLLHLQSEGYTLEYMIGDLDHTSSKGGSVAVVNKGQFYILFPRFKSFGKVKLLNFDLFTVVSMNMILQKWKK